MSEFSWALDSLTLEIASQKSSRTLLGNESQYLLDKYVLHLHSSSGFGVFSTMRQLCTIKKHSYFLSVATEVRVNFDPEMLHP